MLKINSNLSTFAIACAVAVAMGTPLFWNGDIISNPANAEAVETPPRWAASATGRIEPKSGTIRMSAGTSGRIVAIPVKVNDTVKKGDLLVRIDDVDYINRIAAAAAEVDVRRRERDEEPSTGLLKEREDAGDKVAEAERDVFSAQRALDEEYEAYRIGDGNSVAVDSARERLDKANEKLDKARTEFAKVLTKSGMPLPARLEASLSVARAELAMAEQAFERTRIRAPFDGTILNIFTDVGETAAASPDQTVLVFGDVSKLRVRAEVEERDVDRVRIGQRVVLRADAFADREFGGVVTEISSALGSAQIATRGPRRPNDVDVLEVVAELDGNPPLLTGMRVDVFFKRDAEVRQSNAEKTDEQR